MGDRVGVLLESIQSVAKVPDRDRETIWHVGAITAEALCHAALKWQAEAWKRAAAGQLVTGDPAPEGGTDAANGRAARRHKCAANRT